MNKYYPDHNPEEAKSCVSRAIESALREIDLRRLLAVKEAAKSLDHIAWRMLDVAFTEGGVRPFPVKTQAEALSNTPRNAAITRLLQLGLLETDLATRSKEFLLGRLPKDEIRNMDEDMFLYKLTPFGVTVREFFLNTMTAPALVEALVEVLVEIVRQAQIKPPRENNDPGKP